MKLMRGFVLVGIMSALVVGSYWAGWIQGTRRQSLNRLVSNLYEYAGAYLMADALETDGLQNARTLGREDVRVLLYGTMQAYMAHRDQFEKLGTYADVDGPEPEDFHVRFVWHRLKEAKAILWDFPLSEAGAPEGGPGTEESNR